MVDNQAHFISLPLLSLGSSMNDVRALGENEFQGFRNDVVEAIVQTM
jgi:hypothetical protein